MKTTSVRSGLRCGLVAALGCALTSCNTTGDHVIAATGTVIGLEVAQGATGSPAFKLGYDRAELAYVPTNRTASSNGTYTGAEQTADVLMELRYSGIGATSGESGIYQRLAVGKNAVSQAGASVMFAKGSDGKLDSNSATAIAAANKAVTKIPASDESFEAQKSSLRKSYQASTATIQKKYEEAAVAAGYTASGTIPAFLIFTADPTVNQAKIDDMKAKLKERGIDPDAS